MTIQERLYEMREQASCTSPQLGYSKALDALEVAVQALERRLRRERINAKDTLDQITKLLSK